MKYPWMPLFWGDFLANTMHLSAQEAGAYLFLIAHAWEHNGEIPADSMRLSRIAHVRRERWKDVWPVLESFFESHSVGGVIQAWRHSRVQGELRRLAEKSENSRAVSREQHREHGKFTAVKAPLTTSRIINESSSKTQTRSAPTEQASKRAPATALPTGAPARSERQETTPPRSGSSYSVNTPATIPEMDRAKADRQKARLGISPDEGMDYRSPPRPRPEHAHELQAIPDRLVKRPSEDQDFTPGTLPQCATCNCPRSPSGEQKCWGKILANSTMGKLEMAQ